MSPPATTPEPAGRADRAASAHPAASAHRAHRAERATGALSAETRHSALLLVASLGPMAAFAVAMLALSTWLAG